MAPRSIWNGTLAIGDVTVPVKLFSAVQQQRIQFREVRLDDGCRIVHRRFGSESGEEVPSDRIRQAYEISPGHQVMFEEDEVANALAPKDKTLTVEHFVQLAQVDPIYFDKPYFLGAQAGGEHAYRVLATGLEKTGTAAIGRFAMRGRERLVAVAPRQGALGLFTMRYADELIPARSLELPALGAAPAEREVKMAQQLIDTLAADWEPEQFGDRYREAVMSVIERKAAGADVKVPEAPAPKPTADLMGALRESIERSGARKRPRKRTTAPAGPAKKTVGSRSGGKSD